MRQTVSGAGRIGAWVATLAPAFAAMAVNASCGSNGGDGNGDADDMGDERPPVDEMLGQQVTALFDAVCARYQACAADGVLLSSKEGCERFLSGYYGCKPGLATAKVSNADACIQQLTTLSCDALAGDWTGACAATFQSLESALGYKLDGESCSADECAPEYSCAGSDPCNMHCEWDSAGRLGDACVDYCAPGLRCGTESRKCEAAAALEEACTRSQDCASSYCLDGRCQRATRGMPCGENDDCGYLLQCVSGQCEELARVGEKCGERSCTWEAICTNGICEALPACGEAPLGTPCTSSGECEPGLSCTRSYPSFCAPHAAEGESCEEAPCAEGLTCALLLSAGMVCLSDDSMECSQVQGLHITPVATPQPSRPAVGIVRARARWSSAGSQSRHTRSGT